MIFMVIVLQFVKFSFISPLVDYLYICFTLYTPNCNNVVIEKWKMKKAK